MDKRRATSGTGLRMALYNARKHEVSKFGGNKGAIIKLHCIARPTRLKKASLGLAWLRFAVS